MALVLGVIGWLVLSPVVALVVGVVIARAGHLSEVRETLMELVPDTVPATMVADAAPVADPWAPSQAAPTEDVMQLRLSR